MTERTIKIKGLIHEEVCMGTYGLVELELLEIEKEIEALRQLAVINRREQLIDLMMFALSYEGVMSADDILTKWLAEKSINCL